MLLDYGILLFGAAAIKLTIDKVGLTDFLYDNWCNVVDGFGIKNENDKVLTIGHTGILKTPIKVNMEIDPHMFVVGISGSGKSKLAEYCLRDKSVTILNAFKEDFQTLQGDSIVGNENILQYLENCLEGRTKDSATHYVLIDELLVLMRNKKIGDAVANLLAIARHYNLFVIGLSQEGTKEVVKFKNLFNVRVCMRQHEESSIRAVLGCSIPAEDRKMKQREFYVVDSNSLRHGKTYKIDFNTPTETATENASV